MTSIRTAAWSVLVALTLGLLSVGCGGKEGGGGGDGGDTKGPAAPPTAEVSGTVTLPDGKPLPGGWIAFHGKDATEVAFAPIDNGKFTAKGVPVGDEVRVTLDVGIGDELQDLVFQLREAEVRAGLMKQAKATDAELSRRIEDMKDRKKKMEALQRSLKGVNVDPRCLRKETTPLDYKIAPGPQTITVVLK
jgi:hypothetical protein